MRARKVLFTGLSPELFKKGRELASVTLSGQRPYQRHPVPMGRNVDAIVQSATLGY